MTLATIDHGDRQQVIVTPDGIRSYAICWAHCWCRFSAVATTPELASEALKTHVEAAHARESSCVA